MPLKNTYSPVAKSSSNGGQNHPSNDGGASNAWAEFAGVFCRTRSTYTEHETAKSELKSLMPEDAKEAIGHGIRAKRSKSGAVTFDVVNVEAAHAPVQ